jgi:transposase
MSPQHPAPAADDESRPKRSEISTDERNIIIEKLLAGCSTKSVAEEHTRSQRAVQKIYEKYCTTNSVANLPRSGRSTVLSDRQKKLLLRTVRKNPRITYSELAEAAVTTSLDSTTSARPSQATIRRVLKK